MNTLKLIDCRAGGRESSGVVKLRVGIHCTRETRETALVAPPCRTEEAKDVSPRRTWAQGASKTQVIAVRVISACSGVRSVERAKVWALR